MNKMFDLQSTISNLQSAIEAKYKLKIADGFQLSLANNLKY